MNKLFISGNCSIAPETKKAGDKTVCNFNVAVNEGKDKDPQYFRISAWSKLGEICQQYITKGTRVNVWGSVKGRPYKTKTGEAACSMEVTATDVEFFGGSSNKGSNEEATAPNYDKAVATDTSNDMPF